jgi:hypothetical protein
MVSAVFQCDSHHDRKTQADLLVRVLIDLQLSASVPLHALLPAYVVNLHLPQRAGPAIKAKHLVREGDRLVPLEVCDLAATRTRPRRYVFRPELSVESALQCRDFVRREAVHDAFLEGVRDAAAIVLVTRPATMLVIDITREYGRSACDKYIRRHCCGYAVVLGIGSLLE